ncbi:hypothetical protein NDU88_002935 [Pleurodeles waltl]|uniref:Uncharacterized protein n=1 Tax=Pleurodeles waltl TaxID=8319 RepID=A0AAV7UX28_PLEWA|nr:hypothetical protein NDU88_002935 [Pleurodeles waltl]
MFQEAGPSSQGVVAPKRKGGEPSGALAGGGPDKNLMPRSAPSTPEPLSCPRRRHRARIRPEAAAPCPLSGCLTSAQISTELLLYSSPGRRLHPHGNF